MALVALGAALALPTGARADDPSGRPSVAEVFATQPEISAPDYDALRGGYYFAAGTAIRFGVEFVTEINGQPVAPIVNGDPALTTGVMTLVADGQAYVNATDAFTGVMNVVQNSLSSQIIQNATVLQVDLYNIQAALQNGTYTAEVNFMAALGQ